MHLRAHSEHSGIFSSQTFKLKAEVRVRVSVEPLETLKPGRKWSQSYLLCKANINTERELDILFQANPVTEAGHSLEWLSTSLWGSLTRR